MNEKINIDDIYVLKKKYIPEYQKLTAEVVQININDICLFLKEIGYNYVLSKENFLKFYEFDQKLTDENIIKNIIE